MRVRTRRSIIVLALVVVLGCAGDDSSSDVGRPPEVERSPTTGPSSTAPSSAAATDASVASDTRDTTTSAPTTDQPPTSGGEPGDATTPGDGDPGDSTTTATAAPDCDPEEMFAVADALVDDARLAAGGAWETDVTGARFVRRTNTADEFAHRLGFECGVRAVQQAGDGHQRLLVGAWTGDRHAAVIQATDRPSQPFAQAVNFQLMVETAYGEWLEEQFVWAGTMDGGESIVVAAHDAPVALAAKSWPSAIPRFEDLPVTIEAEQVAIDTLVAAGARNVSVAEPTGVGSEIAAVQHVTPDGLHLVATVAPLGWFDAATRLFPGRRRVEQVAGVDVYVTRGAPDAYAVGSVGWECGDHVWFIDSVWGTVGELVDWAGAIIDTAGCGSARLE